MRSYGQLCSVAKALDVLGDRWTLLILRELLIQGPCRYTDLANGLPGIASNLLSERLRNLETSGLVWREAAPPPVATTLFHLTERGRAAEPVLVALARWGTPLIADAAPDDAIRAHWVPFSASVFLRGRDPGGIPVTVQLHTPLGSSVIEITTDGVTSRAGAADEPDITLEGELAMLDALRGDKPDVGLAEAADRVWHWLSDPAHRDLLKLWMEGYARSLMGPVGVWGDFAEQTVTDWLAVLAEYQPRAMRRSTAGAAQRSAVLAILRGALLDLLATGDVERTTAAVHQQLATVG